MNVGLLYWLAFAVWGIVSIGNASYDLLSTDSSLSIWIGIQFLSGIFLIAGAIAGVTSRRDLSDVPSWVVYAGIVGGTLSTVGLLLQ